MDQKYTIEGFIESNPGQNEVSYYNFSILSTLKDGDDVMEITESNVIDDYKDVLLDYAVDVELNEAEKIKYYYNPGLLAYDLYRSVEYEFIILKINGMIDPKDFDIPIIKVIPPQILPDLLSDILNAEQRYIKDNRGEEE